MARRGSANADERVATRPDPDGARPDEHPTELVIRIDRKRGVLGALVVLLAVVALLFVSHSLGLLPGFSNPFGARTTDRSQPVVLKSIQDLSRYEAATANLQVVIDLETDAKFIPSVVFGARTLFVAAGTVDAYVDFAGLDSGAVTVSADRRSVRVLLPRPALEKPNLDQDRSYVFAQQRGIVNRFQSFLNGDGNQLQRLYQVAEQKLANAARGSELAARAEGNTRTMLTGLFSSLGFKSVTITFRSA